MSRRGALAGLLLLAACRTPLPTRAADSEMAAACARAAACAPTAAGSRSVSACLWAQETFLPNLFSTERILISPGAGLAPLLYVARLSCLRDAADCAAYSACVLGPDPNYCMRVPGGPGYCSGDWAVACAPSANPAMPVSTTTQAIDCAASRLDCIIDPSGHAGCGSGLCPPGAPPGCAGEDLVTCENGVAQAEDCARSTGTTCSIDDQGAPACGDPNDCTADHCDGSDAIFCSHGLARRLPCAALPIPGTCRPSGDSVGCVPAPGLTCDPRSHADRCVGRLLVYCDGDEETLDCDALGFSGCANGRCTGG